MKRKKNLYYDKICVILKKNQTVRCAKGVCTMRKKVYKELTYLIDIKLEEISDYFANYNILLEKQAKEIKALSHGGYEIKKMASDFSNEINIKTKELLEEIENRIISSSRKFKPKQISDVEKKCTNKILFIIDDFNTKLQEMFGLIESIEVLLYNLKQRTQYKIAKGIKAVNAMTNAKIDKALLWTAIGTVFAGISLILSVIGILVQ